MNLKTRRWRRLEDSKTLPTLVVALSVPLPKVVQPITTNRLILLQKDLQTDFRNTKRKNFFSRSFSSKHMSSKVNSILAL